MFQDPNCRTGRTERMLQEAERLLAEGKNVVIYCLRHQIPAFKERLGDNGNLTLRSYYFGASNAILSDRNCNLVELFDHAFIQTRLSVWFEEFHRYDEAQS